MSFQKRILIGAVVGFDISLLVFVGVRLVLIYGVGNTSYVRDPWYRSVPSHLDPLYFNRSNRLDKSLFHKVCARSPHDAEALLKEHSVVKISDELASRLTGLKIVPPTEYSFYILRGIDAAGAGATLLYIYAIIRCS